MTKVPEFSYRTRESFYAVHRLAWDRRADGPDVGLRRDANEVNQLSLKVGRLRSPYQAGGADELDELAKFVVDPRDSIDVQVRHGAIQDRSAVGVSAKLVAESVRGLETLCLQAVCIDLSEDAGLPQYGRFATCCKPGESLDGFDLWRAAEATKFTDDRSLPAAGFARYRARWLSIDLPDQWSLESEAVYFGANLEPGRHRSDERFIWHGTTAMGSVSGPIREEESWGKLQSRDQSDLGESRRVLDIKIDDGDGLVKDYYVIEDDGVHLPTVLSNYGDDVDAEEEHPDNRPGHRTYVASIDIGGGLSAFVRLKAEDLLYDRMDALWADVLHSIEVR